MHFRATAFPPAKWTAHYLILTWAIVVTLPDVVATVVRFAVGNLVRPRRDASSTSIHLN